jgi:hypothetical protein
MMTSCFYNYKEQNAISIALYSPKYFVGPKYLDLAPTPEIFFNIKLKKIDKEEYEILYRKNVLSKLNPEHIYKTYKDNVLLCWELPVYKNGEITEFFCHRRIFSKWIFENLNIEIKEFNKNKQINNLKLF